MVISIFGNKKHNLSKNVTKGLNKKDVEAELDDPDVDAFDIDEGKITGVKEGINRSKNKRWQA